MKEWFRAFVLFLGIGLAIGSAVYRHETLSLLAMLLILSTIGSGRLE